jgi:hypothetical protein
MRHDAVNREQIDAGFDRVRAERFLLAHRAEARDPDFWRALNPQLTISELPIPPDAAERAHVEPSVTDRATRQIVDEGYLLAPSLVSPARVDTLRRATLRVVDAGFPAGFVWVYDEFYQAFQGLEALFAPLEFGAPWPFSARLGLVGAWLGVDLVNSAHD